MANENDVAARPVTAWALDHHQEAFAPGTRLTLARSRGLAVQAFRVTPGQVPTVEASDDLSFVRGIQALAERIRSGRSGQAGEPTVSPYPLMYYLTVETAHAEDLYPGLTDDVASQPYSTIDSAQANRRES
ncbi:MAG: hypothetical protein ACRDN0_26945 [Trebonia sp.]